MFLYFFGGVGCFLVHGFNNSFFSLHAKAMDNLKKCFFSGEGTSSLKDFPRINKVNRFLERSQDHLVLVIQPKSVAGDMNYLSNHTLI